VSERIDPRTLPRMCLSKRGYARRAQARQAARERSRWFAGARHYNVYRCPICGAWHLTTRRPS
jgi:hypothetical protein